MSGTFPPRLKPALWEHIGLDWYGDAREQLAPFTAGTTAAEQDLLDLLSEEPGSYWTAHLMAAIARQHHVPPARVRHQMLRLVRYGKAALVADGQAWCATALAPAWPVLKARALALLSDTDAPVLSNFDAIAKALDVTAVSAATITWLLCEESEGIHVRYAGIFTTKQDAVAA